MVRQRANEVEACMAQGLDWRLRSMGAIAVMPKASSAGQSKTRPMPSLTEDEPAMVTLVGDFGLQGRMRGGRAVGGHS